MALLARQTAGLEYLALATSILQRSRRADPSGGDWEAADVQWWWRRDQHPDPARQTVWFEDDQPVAAVAVTDWGDRFSCELFLADHDIPRLIDTLWPVALEQIQHCLHKGVEMSIRADEPIVTDLVLGAGFKPTGETTVTTWMPATERRHVDPVREGFKMLSRSDTASAPHHMVNRNGERVAELLAECSLYRPDLDLAVYAPSGELAGYALFWADLETGVGMVEPMRTEDKFQGMGLGRHLLGSGLDLLARAGCSRLKVCHLKGNERARRLYLGAGFRPAFETLTYGLKQP
jgi:GNAT superfamily N-acetyltransferase